MEHRIDDWKREGIRRLPRQKRSAGGMHSRDQMEGSEHQRAGKWLQAFLPRNYQREEWSEDNTMCRMETKVIKVQRQSDRLWQ